MRLGGNLAIFLFLAWLAPQDSECREKRREGAKGESGNKITVRGKLQGRGGENCTWTVRGDTHYTLNVACTVLIKRKTKQYTCNYTAEPALCPQFVTKPKAYWRQVPRAVQKHQKHLCKGGARRETIRVRMCKSAPTGSHFRLVNPSKEITLTTTPGRDTPTSACASRVDHGALAQEKCGASWASFCNFVFSMVQSTEC